MKHVALLLSFAVYLLLSYAARAQPEQLSPAQTHQDLLFLKHKLDALHPGVGHYTSRQRSEQVFDSLYNALTDSVDYLTFYRHLSPLITTLQDGHTNLNHRRGFLNRSAHYVPFYLRSAGGRYYVSHNVSADTLLGRGTELLSLNGRPLADIHRELMNGDRSGSDGGNVTGRQQWSLIQFADYYAAWFGSADSLTIRYRRPGADTTVRETKLAGITAAQFRTTLHKRYDGEIDRRPNLSLRLVDPASRTAVLRVSSFMGPKRYDPFQRAYGRRLRQAFRTVKREGIENLIVDVQNNGGGLVVNSARLLRYWMPRPFAVMEHEQMKRAARRELITRWNPFSALNFSLRYKPDGFGGFSERSALRRYRPRTRLAFRGNLYFLMNGASFSATTSVLSKTLDAGLGTFVGEACGGAYWGDFAGQFKHVTLPNSRIQVRIPLKKLTHAVRADRANGFTVEPDFTVARSYDDLLTGRDYVLSYTLQLIRQGVVARHRSGYTSLQPLQASR